MSMSMTTTTTTTTSVEYFDRQFIQQIEAHDFALNPFESRTAPFLRGQVLDFGCGLGNLAVHAARHGHRVTALDASASAIDHLRGLAARESLPINALQADLRSTQLDEQFETVVSIGLLMFFDCPTALRQVEHLMSLVLPGGILAINVLIEGTTFLDMFSSQGHCLFKPDALIDRLRGWTILVDECSRFAAPRSTVKVFSTVIAQKPL